MTAKQFLKVKKDHGFTFNKCELDAPRYAPIIVSLILLQLFASSALTYWIITIKTPPFLFALKVLSWFVLLIFLFVTLQGLTVQLILRIMKPSVKRHVILGHAYISTHFLIPLIPISQPVVFFLRILGAKIGKNVSIAVGSRFLEPYLLEIDDNTAIGSYVLITCHVREKEKFITGPVIIGKNCLIGAKSFIQPRVSIGDNSVIAAGALVPKNKILPPNTVWGGIPAKKIKVLGN